MLFQPRRTRPLPPTAVHCIQQPRRRWNDGPRLSATDPTVKWCISLDHENERRRRRKRDGKKSNNKFIDRRATRYYKTRRWRGHVYVYLGIYVLIYCRYLRAVVPTWLGTSIYIVKKRSAVARPTISICSERVLRYRRYGHMHTEKWEKQNGCSVCVMCVDEDDFDDEITCRYTTYRQTDRQTDRHRQTFILHIII